MAKKNNFFNLYLKVNDKEASQTLNSVGADLRKLRGYTRNLEEGTEKWHEANKKLAEVEKTYDGMKKKQRDFINETKTATEATEDQTSAMQEFGENASEAFSSLMAGDLIGFQSALVGLKAGIMGATKAAWAFIMTPLGATIAALAAVGLAAREWFQYNEQAREANILTQQLTQLSGDAMDQARIRATALEKTFGTEFKDNLKVARNLVQAFGISYEEAFDTIEEGLVRGGAQSDEFMDSLKEYPKFFAQAGYTVQEFQRILNSGEALGMYSDKLPDAIKEFQLSVSEQTTASRDALENAFGKKFTDELFANINNGSITSKDALELISGEAENIGLNAQQASQLTADLFRGAGEDAGGALLIFEAVNQALGDQAVQYTALQQHTKDLADAHADLEKAQSDALKSDKYAAFASQLEITWIRAKEDFYLFINGMMEGFVEADTAFRRFVFQSVQYVKDAFTIGKDADWEKLGQQFDAQQKKIEDAAAARRKEQEQNEKNKQNEKPDPVNPYSTGTQSGGDKKGSKKEEDVAAEATKRAEKEKAIRAKVEEQLKAWEEEREIQEQLEKFEKDQRAEEEEILKLEAKFAKLEKQAEGEKELLARLEEEKELQIQEIRNKYSEDRLSKEKEQKKKLLEEEKKFKAELIAAEQNLQQAKEQALMGGIGALKGFFGEASVIYKMLLGLEKALAINEIVVNASSAIAQAQANLATVPPFIGPLPNPMYPIAVATTAKNVLATKISAGTQIASIAATTLQGFDKGGFTDMFGMGYRDKSGEEVAGVVHTGEYVIPKFVRQDPEVPNIIDYLENKRKRKLSGYNKGGDVEERPQTVTPASGSSRTDQLLEMILEATAAKGDILFGYEAEQKRQEQEEKLRKIKDRSKIKKD